MRSLLCALVLFLSVGSAVAEPTIAYPIAVVSEATEQAGVFNRRQQPQPQPAPGQPAPPADGNRTAPVNPNAPPKFDAAPSEGGTLSLAELTPDQKAQLFQAITAIISALLGAFAGSGKAGPFLTAILQAFKGIADPVPPKPAKARARATKAPVKSKAKPKAASPDSK